MRLATEWLRIVSPTGLVLFGARCRWSR